MYKQAIFTLLLALLPFSSKGETIFHKDRSIVWLNIYENLIGDESLDTLKIFKMLLPISTRFTKILWRISGSEIENNQWILPKVVAKFNTERTFNSNDPLELQLMYYPKDSGNTSHQLLINFIQYANEANSIFDGTVKTFYLYSKGETCEEYDTHWDGLMNIFSDSRSSFNLGVYLRHSKAQMLYKCITKNLTSSFAHISHLLLHEKVESGNALTLQRELDKLLTEFSETKLAMRNAITLASRKNLELVFETGYSESAVESEEGLIMFWKTLNRWTVDANTTCLYYEVFDNQTDSAKLGWWRQSEEQHYYTSTFVYEEKEAVLEAKKLYDSIRNQTVTNYKWTVQDYIITCNICLSITFGLGFLWLIFSKRVAPYLKSKNIFSKKELQLFYEGKLGQDYITGQKWKEIDNLKYDKALEIPIGSFKLGDRIKPTDCIFKHMDSASSLHTDRFQDNGDAVSSSFRANLVTKDPVIPVVVKVANSYNKPATMALLHELKVLSHLGKHRSIIQLVGACTTELHKGQVYVFTEACPGVTLHAYLTLLKCGNNVFGTQGESMYSKFTVYNDLQVDLRNWSSGITEAMVFLASKNIVLGNLATRNLLLDNNKQVKISSLNFIYRIFNSSEGKEAKMEILPWRWLPPETIRRLIFNERTDVWSYGVTLWEIYSLGELPFHWAIAKENFLAGLEGGKTLSFPVFCYDMTSYETVIQSCLEIQPWLRPTFQQIQDKINKLTILSNKDGQGEGAAK